MSWSESAHATTGESLEPCYTLSNINALSSHLAWGLESILSSTDISAVLRAVLHHQAYWDGRHFSVRRKQGLHPEFIGVHGLGTPTISEQVDTVMLLDTSTKDVFDAVSSLWLNRVDQ
jgi:hypothetical protein